MNEAKMDLDQIRIKTTKPAVDYDVLINKIKMGKAVLFTGAGFSFGAKNTLCVFR